MLFRSRAHGGEASGGVDRCRRARLSHPHATLPDVEGVPALRFAAAARSLGVAARAAGLEVPAFRSPPRLPGANRSIRRFPGGAIVAVRVRGRSLAPVLEDMVEGVLVANRVRGEARPRLRLALLAAALGDAVPGPAPSPGPATAPTLTEPTRVAERETQAA